MPGITVCNFIENIDYENMTASIKDKHGHQSVKSSSPILFSSSSSTVVTFRILLVKHNN